MLTRRHIVMFVVVINQDVAFYCFNQELDTFINKLLQFDLPCKYDIHSFNCIHLLLAIFDCIIIFVLSHAFPVIG